MLSRRHKRKLRFFTFVRRGVPEIHKRRKRNTNVSYKRTTNVRLKSTNVQQTYNKRKAQIHTVLTNVMQTYYKRSANVRK